MRIVVEKTLNNGCGMGRDAEGRIVFVPGGLAGEPYEVSRFAKRKSVLWAKACERLEDAAIRRRPPCPHFGECGGCGLLHVRDEDELSVKIAFLEDALQRIGKLEHWRIDARPLPAEGSRARGKLHVDGAGRLGFRTAGSESIAPIETCRVMPPTVAALLPALRAETRRRRFRGDIFFAVGNGDPRPVFELRGSFANRPFDGPASLHGARGVKLANDKGEELARWGEPVAPFVWNGVSLSLEPSQFFQSNPRSWPIFFEWTARYAREWDLGAVWDVHAGAGFLSTCLGGRAILASEPDPLAQNALAKALSQIEGSHRIFRGPAERALADSSLSLASLDGAVLDPPRTGLSPALRDWLAASGPPSLLYFSCDVASFSRDLRRLTASGYCLASPILAMNVSPGSLRLETAAVLRRWDRVNS